MQGAEVLTRFTADTKDFDKKAKGLNTSISSIAKGVLVATGVTKALSTAFSLVSKNMGTAIDRFDTLNNFPKVMSNLGISAEESQKSIDKLSEKLVGLPTTLQDGALAVQRLTSKNSDIKKSTDLFLAMNNAILAGGASSQIQSNAIEQLSQAYAKGKPDMMEWRSIMTAMPAQLKQVATAMGYVDADALGESLRDGTVSMDEFMNTIDKLNKEGLPGFQNFEEQARNATGGIRTAITNMNSRIAAGITDAINSIDKALATTPLGGIANFFSNFGSAFKTKISSFGIYVGDLLKNVLTGAMSSADLGVEMSNKLSKLFIDGVNKLNAILPTIIKNLMDFLMGAINGLVPHIPKIIKVVVDGIINALLTILDNIDQIIDAGINLLMALTDGIIQYLPVLIDRLPEIIEKIVTVFINNAPKLRKAALQIIVKLAEGLINSIPQLISKVPEIISRLIKAFTGLASKMKQAGKDAIQGFINGMTGMIGKVVSKATSIGSSALSAIKKKLGIHSPSTEFALIGKFSVMGYTEQLDKMTKEVQSQIAETFSISPQLSATTGMHYSPNVNVYNNVDVRQDPLGQMVNNIKTYSGGAKNDYNYGAGF